MVSLSPNNTSTSSRLATAETDAMLDNGGSSNGTDAGEHTSIAPGPQFRAKDIPFVLVSVLTFATAYALVPLAEIPLTVLIVSFGIQWAMFIPAVIYQTEKYYDLTGSLTYLSLTLYTFAAGNHDMRSVLATICVCIWCTRLGSFLFQRIQKDGKDSRFDTLKPYFFRFFNVWSIQGLWVFLTALPVYTLNSSEDTRPLTFVDLLGLCLWVFGFALEVTADRQKSEWRDNPVNKGRFITVGLWGLSRHPNYFGESTLWLGMFIVSTPILHGWQWICAISPIFVVLLLTKVSGVPLLEKKADEKWGDEEEYQKYKRETPIFIPKLPSM